MKPKSLKKIRRSQIQVFKIKNRKGFAAICMNNLTEGSTPNQAISRLKYPLARIGYAI